ncbi:MAG: RNA 2',3'-cyclic phosphodiesterase [Pseudomonadota bacterium]
MRAFVAIRPGIAAVEALVEIQRDLNVGRCMPEENFHVTLAFLDYQPVHALEALHDAVSEIYMRNIDLIFSGVEARGGRKPALIWASVEPNEQIQRLQARIRNAAHKAGIELPRRRFRPHVTLSRLSRTAPVDMDRLREWLAQNASFRTGPFEAESVCLYQSRLTPDGALYEILAEYPLHPFRQ